MIRLRQGGWAGLWGAAFVASLSPLSVQLGFAVIAIGFIGMAHGASDLEVVRRERRLPFLVAYGLVIVLCLFWWHNNSALALPGFLLASAIHFTLEDAPRGHLIERLARGIGMITIPATLHLNSFSTILYQAGLTSAIPDSVAAGIALTGGICAVGLIVTGVRRHNISLITGILALLLLPPFVGFSMGFLILHALPQTRLRRDQLGCRSYNSYLYATWPILTAAILLAAATAVMMHPADRAGIQSLFAALAALAIPHMLITPWFEPQQQA
ncbi:Brp/Blh family beta-carotene 15,15'-dioxygenase [Pantoea sp.]|uniref:Brp/Blh family beta-carotene 15,15'-dioxygenase n=1 Tax=Pantoea sp. TaxID=69393 RepID=UPI0028B1B7C9|nr:Brp/Blh family beta-carotene 15,15'-dioxygenase [Pantoea sp.]